MDIRSPPAELETGKLRKCEGERIGGGLRGGLNYSVFTASAMRASEVRNRKEPGSPKIIY